MVIYLRISDDLDVRMKIPHVFDVGDVGCIMVAFDPHKNTDLLRVSTSSWMHIALILYCIWCRYNCIRCAYLKRTLWHWSGLR